MLVMEVIVRLQDQGAVRLDHLAIDTWQSVDMKGRGRYEASH
jgi:hypothetical protein